MVSQNGNIDYSMLELFRVELDNNSHILEKGLINIENQGENVDLEPLMRAAHSLKGAARIVGLPKAVELSHTMEDLLEKALKKNYKLTEVDIENLLDGNDIYLDLLNYDYTEIPDQIENNVSKIDEIINNLKNPKIVESKPKLNGVQKAVPPKEKSIKNLTIEKSDSFMIDLFIKELKSDLELLQNSLSKYNESKNVDILNSILQSIHSLKGASRIIKMEPVNYLNTKLEECVIKLIESKIILNLDFTFIINLYNEALSGDIKNIYEFFYSKYDEIEQFIEDFCNDKKHLIQLSKPEIQDDSALLIDTNIQATGKIKEDKEEAKDINTAKQIRKTNDDRFVRVYSESLNRILGLSGEVLVQTRLIRPFISELQKIKREFLEINTIKEEIYQRLFDYEIEDDVKSKFNDSSVLLDKILSMLLEHIQNFDNFSRRVEITADKLYNETISTRMKPFEEGLSGFTRMVRDVSKKLNKNVELVIKGKNTKVDRDILEKLESPLNHLVSNAIDHAIESPEERERLGKPKVGRITLDAKHTAGMLLISISDDGKGIDKDSLRRKVAERKMTTMEVASRISDNELYAFLFLPGFSTKDKISEISGRGVGLDIVASSLNEIGGTIKVDSEVGVGTTFTMELPLTLSVIRSLLVEVAGQTYAFPISKIERALTVNKNEILTIENNEYITYENDNIGIINASQIFGINYEKSSSNIYNIILIKDRLKRYSNEDKPNKYGIVVDKFIGQPDLVLLKLDKRLGRIPNISNGAILEDGSPTLVVDIDDLVSSIESILKFGKIEKISLKENIIKEYKTKKILVVEDSLTVREVERKLLENRGYKVTVAVDGIDGWNVLHRGEDFDLIISDIDMPRMNGIDLVKKIRTEEKFKEIPIMIVSYKDREEDKLKGLEAGANYYLAKSSFHDDTLINAVEDLIGVV